MTVSFWAGCSVVPVVTATSIDFEIVVSAVADVFGSTDDVNVSSRSALDSAFTFLF